MCPRDENTWCKFQLDKLKGTDKHKNRINLPVAIHHLLRPMFQSLSDDNLLSKGLHGETQNTNESFNSVVSKQSLLTKEPLKLA